MLRKMYVSPVVGTGTALDPFRAKVVDYGVRCMSEIPPGAQVGDLVLSVVWASILDHARLVADPEISFTLNQSNLHRADIAQSIIDAIG